jgi:GH15 family glucan-1,4-alpha-glucosidase
MPYKPIGSYGVIGNMRTAALVAMDGSIDWLCFPRFDSPSVFAAILDDKKGGFFRIAPSEKTDLKQFYWPETNVLVTRFLHEDGVGELTDFMPVGGRASDEDWLIRHVKVPRGRVTFRLECRPAFDYARAEHAVHIDRNGACFSTPRLTIGLHTKIPLRRDGQGAVAEFTLEEGQQAAFALRQLPPGRACSAALDERDGEAALRRTVAYWHRWLSKCTYQGRWRETVQRSALALKLLSYEPTGAVVAAPTCSLPERVGSHKNWDYRYTWIRDAAFTIYSLLRIGLHEEAAAFMGWIEGRCHELKPGVPLQIMYGIGGEHDISEEVLPHLEGYMGSAPVRIGNGAYDQLQLDVYGELMDSVYLYNKHGSPIAYELWKHLRHLTNWVCEQWGAPDHGIWEHRGVRRHYTHSKLMCWVCVDRAIRLADKRGFPADYKKWYEARDAIFEDIMARGWNEKRRAFTHAYGADTLDSANLMMPLVFFLAADDPQMLSTIEAIIKPPREGGLFSDSLLYRYDRSIFGGSLNEEGSFNICTFWLVDALTRAGRDRPHYLSEARLIFEKMLAYGNHLGLYGEETGPRGEALGNFPQAFTHLALISAATNLDRALGGGK